MADAELMDILAEGPEVWNSWRSSRGLFRPDLRAADLAGASLSGVHLDGADLDDCQMAGAGLQGARLAGAVLNGSNLEGADLTEAALSDSRLVAACLDRSTLHSADLNGASLNDASLVGANLESANLALADLSGADVTAARLVGANLLDTLAGRADFSNATVGARHRTGRLPDGAGDLGELIQRGADIAPLLEHRGRTTFGNVDLSTASGLASVVHHGPSSIGIDTLMATAEGLFGRPDAAEQAGAIEIFLRGAGVHDEALAMFPILIRHPVFYSVFISYSHRDATLVDRLELGLTRAGVATYLDRKKSTAGATISASLKDAIIKHDRVVLICSASSLASDWVADEIGYATDKELELGSRQPILIPVLTDGSTVDWTDRHGGLIADRFAIDLRDGVDDPIAFQERVNELVDVLRTATT